MNRRHFALATALFFIPLAAQAQLARLTVNVQGLEPASGSLEVSVFNSAESFMQNPQIQQSMPVNGKDELSFQFSGLLEGTYAVVVVHDENDNKALDSGFLGFGAESYGFSNDASAWFGWPSFESASVSVGKEDLAIVINLD
ncbi:MAG TPA: DUF2141 domain-containing protein [Xanthomonadales bacterium]|nr:DUF2141 domain-containing protein [Xanthomonadales bacterium]